MFSEEAYARFRNTKWVRRYSNVFSIEELESSTRLAWLCGSLLITAMYAFGGWAGYSTVTLNAVEAGWHTCPPYFQSCGDWYFARPLPAYSQALLYMAFFAVMGVAAAGIAARRWVFVHLAMLILWIWEVINLLFLQQGMLGNYDHFHMMILAMVLFVPNKLAMARLTWVFLYFLAATVKFDGAWVVGTYFSNLQVGLPIIPDWAIPLATNAVIFMELFVSWLLLSSRSRLQRAAVAIFVLFHLYSGGLVLYRYPLTCVPPLLILFGPGFRANSMPFSRRNIVGYAMIGLFSLAHLAPEFIAGNRRMTGEANTLGLYMFEANHQCSSQVTKNYRVGPPQNSVQEQKSARERCDPYMSWFRLRNACRLDTNIESIRWTFDHSINGGPFYRIVDTEDACSLEYKFLRHNSWIRTPEEGAPMVGRPVKNIYR